MFKIKRYQLSNDNLKNWVKFIWHFEADHVDVDHKLLPMDSIDIIINLADDMVYETTTDRITAPKLHVNGLRGWHSFMHQKGNIDVWGISFYAFGLYPFINKSLKNIQNEIIDLNSLSISLADKLKVAVTNETTQCKIKSIMESLDSELEITDSCLKRAEIIDEFMKNDDIPISVFCLNNGISQKMFERFVVNMTGFSPVNLRRIKRYMVASNQLLFNKSAKISEIVYDHNYTDQAYFTKECRTFTGVSPRTFRQEKNTVIENTIYI
ncbi:helix-turn-helix domain-containing protein [Lacrimispora sp. 38-1]|uniref:helix-turn-helix domain-containing protein n=1 Tax=Lacrimispora sp. 38-1 TaxID=3125778 RepID=UPI003CF12EFA